MYLMADRTKTFQANRIAAVMIAFSLPMVGEPPAWASPPEAPQACASDATIAAQNKAEAFERDRNEAAAKQHYLVAANCGLAVPQRQLGLMLLSGRGGAKNESEAVGWLLKAATQGDALGQLGLATALRHGAGIAKDEAASHQWYLAAARQGIPMAQYYVGTQFSSGRGTTVDKLEANRWFYLAAVSGHALAQMAIAHQENSAFNLDTRQRQHLVRAYAWARLAGRYTCSSAFKPSGNAAALEPSRKTICDFVEQMRAAATDHLKPNELVDAGKMVDAWTSGSTILPILTDDIVRRLSHEPGAKEGDQVTERQPTKPNRKRELAGLESWMSGQITTAEGARFIAVLTVFDGNKRRGYLQLICPERSVTGPMLLLSRDLFDTPPEKADIDHFNGSPVTRVNPPNHVVLPIDFKLALSKPSAPGTTQPDRVRLTPDILNAGKGTFTFRLNHKDEPDIVVKPRISRTDPAAQTAMAEFAQQNFKPSDLRSALVKCQGFVKPTL